MLHDITFLTNCILKNLRFYIQVSFKLGIALNDIYIKQTQHQHYLTTLHYYQQLPNGSINLDVSWTTSKTSIGQGAQLTRHIKRVRAVML